jgi:hypothetical protein
LFQGHPIEIRYRRDLRDNAGNAAHAATFIRQRLILLDHELKQQPDEHARILLHELFHFVWIRLGNQRRQAWERHLAAEWQARTRGEAGWSAEWRKQALAPSDIAARNRRWREYCCESFCDTAACIYNEHPSDETTLAPTRLAARGRWFTANLPAPPFPI